MTLNSSLQLTQVCGNNVILFPDNGSKMKMVRLNDTACFLWKTFIKAASFTISDMSQALMSEYEIDEATAMADAESLASRWQQAGLLK